MLSFSFVEESMYVYGVYSYNEFLSVYNFIILVKPTFGNDYRNDFYEDNQRSKSVPPVYHLQLSS